jgi:hypothetical protein
VAALEYSASAIAARGQNRFSGVFGAIDRERLGWSRLCQQRVEV